MKLTHRMVTWAGLLAFGVTASQAMAADAQAGKKKAEEVCVACHGVDGNSASDQFPKIAGQPADYLAASLHKYKAGKRNNPIMAGMVAALSEKDIENVSAWYAQQKGLFVKY